MAAHLSCAIALTFSFLIQKVLDFHWQDYQRSQWGKVYLHTDFHNGWNQRWQVIRGEIVCKGFPRQTVPNLCLDVFGSQSGNGAKVGVYAKTGGQNQRWQLKSTSNILLQIQQKSNKILIN